MWDINSNIYIEKLFFKNHSKIVTDIEFLDHDNFVSCSKDGTVMLQSTKNDSLKMDNFIKPYCSAFNIYGECIFTSIPKKDLSEFEPKFSQEYITSLCSIETNETEDETEMFVYLCLNYILQHPHKNNTKISYEELFELLIHNYNITVNADNVEIAKMWKSLKLIINMFLVNKKREKNSYEIILKKDIILNEKLNALILDHPKSTVLKTKIKSEKNILKNSKNRRIVSDILKALIQHFEQNSNGLVDVLITTYLLIIFDNFISKNNMRFNVIMNFISILRRLKLDCMATSFINTCGDSKIIDKFQEITLIDLSCSTCIKPIKINNKRDQQNCIKCKPIHKNTMDCTIWYNIKH